MIENIYQKSDERRLFDLEKYSGDVQTIMTTPPSWLIRWGLLIFFIVIFLILGVSYFIQYPDIVKANFAMNAHSPTIKFVTKETGRIHFLVNDQDTVKRGQILGYIENSTTFSDVLKYMAIRDTLRETLTNQNFDKIPDLIRLNLGEIQDFYAILIANIKNYENYIKENKLSVNMSIIKKQYEIQSDLQNKLKEETILHNERSELGYQKFLRDSLLYTQKVLSKQEYENSKRDNIPNKLMIEELKRTLKSAELNNIELESDMKNLSISEGRYINELRTKIILSFNDLEKRFLNWEDRFLFRSPIDGQVTLFEIRDDNQNVVSGEEIINITQLDQQNVYGYALLPIEYSTKVKMAMKVNIELTNYPAHEYGFVEGEVTSLSKIPKNGNYYIGIEILNIPRINKERPIQLSEQMIGTANIITEDLRLLERFYYKLIKIIRQK